jgi:protocatechuate 3,4-dioxygenase beta subunit
MPHSAPAAIRFSFAAAALCVAVFAGSAVAEITMQDLPEIPEKLTDCIPTPALRTENYPGSKAIFKGNNLLRPTGKSVDAEGQRLVLLGRVVDENCVPVLGATVEIWQTSPFGKWILATADDLATPNATFAGAGRTYTDNNGHFSFITSFPGPLKNRAPNINIKVESKGIKTLSTQLFFDNDERNANEASLKKLKDDAARNRLMLRMQPMDSGGYTGLIDITLDGEAPMREF